MESLKRVHPQNNLGIWSIPEVHYAIVSDFYKIVAVANYRYRYTFSEFFLETSKHRALQNLLTHRIVFEKWNL